MFFSIVLATILQVVSSHFLKFQNTFQAIITTSFTSTFAVFLYGVMDAIDPATVRTLTNTHAFTLVIMFAYGHARIQRRIGVRTSPLKNHKAIVFLCNSGPESLENHITTKVRKRAKIRNRYNQAPRLTKDANEKVTTSHLDTTNKSQEISPFPEVTTRHQQTDVHESITK